ncbi:uncharacterized protein DUF4345 [Humitalea rosea]|uniref:Uncharacterized protein DUF4345 n=1 Tax=Humitalea rosea TaxID=990373 RepID=A0A2W7IMU1_9PROT|nr:DUF4345 domain-containing protein [Humitalea rosea]PZW48155.1 uncharacterized protein DUF4345 [Humitalea rosea]
MRTQSLNRLRLAIQLAGIVPVSAGLAGVLTGFGVLNETMSGAADSHMRYLSGLLLGIGLGVWWCQAALERRGMVFDALCVVVIIGGLGRLFGVALNGPPPLTHVLALGMELGVTPALWLWRHHLLGRGLL